MAKKIIMILLVFILSLSGNYTAVYASNIDELENRGETENLAGITWDQISELSNNSPNSLAPIQGLVLWMFMILAFLKLAQKMDSLLQSLGLNVTQSGGRAIGDLLMAGMALKNIGGMMSKGMGMIGFGKGGSGASGGTGTGTGSGTGSRSAGGSGPSPIPTGGPGRGSAPGSSHAGAPRPGSRTPAGGMPSGGTSTGSDSTGSTSPGSAPTGPAHASGTPSGTASSSGSPRGATPTSNPSGTTGATDSGSASGSRNPIGKAADWMKQEGFAQGAIKAGAKGGIIGLGAYTVKAGASKIGEAISSRFSNQSISADPNNDLTTDINTQDRTGTADVNNSANPEEYLDSRPLNGSDDQTPISATINGEEYQEASAFDSSDASDESGAITSFNDEDYNDVNSFNAAGDSNPIPSSAGDEAGQDYESDSGDASSDSPVYKDEGEVWHDSKPINTTNETQPIPTVHNSAAWNETTPSGGQNGSIAVAAINDGTAPLQPQPTASIPISSPRQEVDTVSASGAHPQSANAQSEASAVGASGLKTSQTESTTVQTGSAALQHGNADSVSIADSAMQQDSSITAVSSSDSSSVSSERVSVFSESSATHESAEHESSAGYGSVNSSSESESSTGYGSVNSGSESENNSGDVYESRQMPLNNQIISADLPQNSAQQISEQAAIESSGANPIVSSDASSHDYAAAVHISAQPEVTGVNINSDTAQSEAVQNAQAQTTPESIRTDFTTSAQVQDTAVATTGEQVSMPQQNTTVKSQTTNVTHVTETGAAKPGQAAAQPAAQVVQVEKQGLGTNPPANPQSTRNNRPTAKGKSKHPTVKARKKSVK